MMTKQPVLMGTLVLILAALIIFVVLPLLNIVKLAVTDGNGAFNIAVVGKVLKNPDYRTTIVNTLKLGVVVALIATFVGYIFAFAMARTEMPGKKFFDFIATFPIISPPFVLCLAMIFLFGRQGLITKGLFGIKDSEVFGVHSLIIVQSISFFPIAYMTLRGILESIDDSVEDAAYNMGASRGRTFLTVILPLSLSGVLSSLLLVFIQSLEDFSNPSVIAGRYSTLAVESYHAISGRFDLQTGAILALLLLIPSLLTFAFQRYWMSKKSFVTVTGKPTQKRRKIHEKHIVIPLTVFCGLIAGAIILLYGTVLMGAFVKTWGVDYTLTLDHFGYVMSVGKDALWSSVKLAIVAAPIAGLLGMAIAYFTVRYKFFGRKFMEISSMLTMAVPGTVLGLGYAYTYNKNPLMLTGTAIILIVAFVFRNMPLGIESGTSTLLQIDPSIEEASTILGAGSGKTFRKITLPLLQQSFYSGLIYSFVRSMTSVSMVVFLISPKWNLATTRIFALFEASQYSDAAAYIFMMILVILVFMVVVRFIIDLLFKPKYLRKRKTSRKKAGLAAQEM